MDGFGCRYSVKLAAYAVALQRTNFTVQGCSQKPRDKQQSARANVQPCAARLVYRHARGARIFPISHQGGRQLMPRGEYSNRTLVLALLLARSARGCQKNLGEHHDASSPSKVLAVFMSSVSKPSVNQP